MDSYQDIRVLPNPELSIERLMSALFAKLHLALGQFAVGRVGVSFPRAAATPGDVLRLHGCARVLASFESLTWCQGLCKHIESSGILAVPAGVKYRVVSRYQVKSNAERLRRRSIKKCWLTDEQALERIPDSRSQRCDLPFIALKSLSTGQRFRLFIRQGELRDSPTQGIFGSYGLSATATVPWF